MKIQNSHVNMASTHNSYSHSYVESITIERRASNDTLSAIMELSEEGEKSYKESIEQMVKDEEKSKNDQNEKNLSSLITDMSKTGISMGSWQPAEDLQITMLKKMLEILSGKKMKFYDNLRTLDIGNHLGIKGEYSFDQSTGIVEVAPQKAGTTTGNLTLNTSPARFSVWQRVTATEGMHLEYENTSFSTQGTVQTEDGRSLNFNVEVQLGRSLSQKINTLSAETFTKVLTDPLVINMDSNITSVSDQKFKFDLDADGKEDEISFLGKGSGFLALDKNGDGIINDGSELFGTKSGDGFKDLAEYDEDHNGWIDENDSIFSKLKVWTKDEEGNDRLLDLKEADVGAIYLGNVDTEFSYKNLEGETNGVLRKSGIYLKESSGAACTVAHVDLAL